MDPITLQEEYTCNCEYFEAGVCSDCGKHSLCDVCNDHSWDSRCEICNGRRICENCYYRCSNCSLRICNVCREKGRYCDCELQE